MKTNTNKLLAAITLGVLFAGSVFAESDDDRRSRMERETKQRNEQIRKENIEQTKDFHRQTEEQRQRDAINRNAREIARLKADKAKIESNKKKK